MYRKKIKVAVLSSRFLIGEGLKSLILGNSGLQFTDWAGSEEGVDDLLAGTLKPDVLILDAGSEFIKQADVIMQLKQKFDQIGFLIMADEYEAAEVRKMISVGINVFLLCGCEKTEIESAITAVHNNERFICDKILDLILTDIDKPKNCELIRLSDREMEIINNVAEGLSSKEIKEVLNLSVHTINTHKRNIYRKLGINKSSDLIRFAVKNGMMEHLHAQ